MEKRKIGISIGDINGIGLEVILKTLAHEYVAKQCIPVIFGSSKVVSYHKNIVDADFHFHIARSTDHLDPDKVNVINCWTDNVNISLGKPTPESGQYAYQSLEYATAELKAGRIDALVTAPINKEAMKMADFPFPGHTEYLSQELGGGHSLMLMVHEALKVGLVTNHLPISEVAGAVTREQVMQKIHLLDQSLRMDFGLEKPTLAVLGLNPHAGDGGAIGKEDEEIVRPSVIECKEKGMLVMGPYPADGFFGSGQYRKFDGILAMYHDQGLVPFKTLAFGGGVNFTAGLPHVRTSPDHGTAYDLAGKNMADPSSFRQAFFLALDIARQRRNYQEIYSNALRRNEEVLHQVDEVLRNDEEEDA